tara:strand:- start:2109 stop:2546 length:438 start_codon:yes stop_codon:yes gene_type:complete
MYRVIKTYGHDRGYSCAFRQWSAKSNCKYLHGYSLGFKITLQSPTLDENNWVYDFGNFSFLEDWLIQNFDHTLLVAQNDPEKEMLKLLNTKVARVIELEKISCEYFAEMTYEYIDEHLSNIDVEVISVEVSEHGSNAAIYTKSNA